MHLDIPGRTRLVPPLFLVLALIVARPRSAPSQSLRPDVTVRATLSTGSDITGRIVRSDSTHLVLHTGDTTVSIERSGIATLSRRSDKRVRYATVTAITTGAVFTVLGSLMAVGLCEGQCDGAGRDGAIYGGLLGLATGAHLGYTIGSLVPRWVGVDRGVATAPLDRASQCWSDRGVMADAGIATDLTRTPHGSGPTGHLSTTLHCDPGSDAGFEAGFLGQPGLAPAPETEQRNAAYAGIYAEHVISRPLDARLITSLGFYASTIRSNYLQQTNTSTARSPGGSIGVSIGIPVTAHTALRLEGRTHLIDGGAMSTATLGLRYRP